MINSIAYSGFKRVSSSLQSFYQLRLNRIHKFKAKIEISTKVGPFEIKTVTNTEELKEALALRFEVFQREMLGKSATSQGFDVDEFDFTCDHLIIKERRSQRIIGTYRLTCSLFTQNFYSGKEFMISHLFQKPGVKLELGRACIHKDYRAYRTRPTLAYTMPMLNYFLNEARFPLTECQKARAEELLPPLCRAYLKIGASIGGEPAWDREFQCIDFLTILERENLNRTLWRRFKLDEITQ